MQLEGDEKKEETLAARHELDSKLTSALIEKKKKMLAEVVANQQKQDDAFKNHAELRKAIDETETLR